MLLTLNEVAIRWGLSYWSLNRRVKDGSIKTVQVGPRPMIHLDEVLRIESGGAGAPKSASRASPKRIPATKKNPSDAKHGAKSRAPTSKGVDKFAGPKKNRAGLSRPGARRLFRGESNANLSVFPISFNARFRLPGGGMTSRRLPWLKFYPSDWLVDAIAGCLAAQGLWLRLLFVMHDAIPYGRLAAEGKPIPDEALSRRAGCESVEQFRGLLAELFAAGVPGRGADGIVFSRRMVRDQQVRPDGETDRGGAQSR